VETSDSKFEQDVLERSRSVPVVVDFWAEWCQPCRTLGPVLEQLAVEKDGQFVLVKADTEATPRAAAEFHVQSIPAVYGVRDGRIVDGFLGALPPEEVRHWLDRLLPSAAEQLLAEGRALAASDPAAAEAKLRQAIADDAHLFDAQIALAALLLEQHQVDACREQIDQLEQRGFLEPEAEKVKAALERRLQGAAVADVEACRSAVANAPDDPQLHLNLADALAARQQYEEALQICLQVVQQGAGTQRETARRTMVDIFRLLPDDSPLARDYRRKLSMALY
jgi:putative thioredoxin